MKLYKLEKILQTSYAISKTHSLEDLYVSQK